MRLLPWGRNPLRALTTVVHEIRGRAIVGTVTAEGTIRYGSDEYCNLTSPRSPLVRSAVHTWRLATRVPLY